MRSKLKLVLLLLFLGVIYRLILTWDGNFIFNMDNARDMLDVREMVVLQKPRFTGPTSGLEGIYNGPGWYYLLSIPFILSAGHPYSSVILMIIFWFIGGLFIYKLMLRYGNLTLLVTITIWLSSNYVILANLYAYNPNPVVLLTPLLIFLLVKSLTTQSLKYSIMTGFLGGLFFNFEMAFGLFVPLIVLIAALILNKKYLTSRSFYLGISAFILTLLPQVVFYFKNWPLLINSTGKFFGEAGIMGITDNIVGRFLKIEQLYFNVLSGTMMNWKPLVFLSVLAVLFLIVKLFLDKNLKQDRILVVTLTFILVPFVSSFILPFNFMPWHLGGQMAAVILLLGIFIKYLADLGHFFKILSAILSFLIIVYAVNNLELGKNLFLPKKNNDAALLVNQIKAIDYVYSQAKGQNFKVYIYLPSVYDYPYQYLFWWYGQRKYGYLPQDYSYLPDKPPYIRNKEKFSNGARPLESDLVFLIKQPDQIGERHLWENSFANLAVISTYKIASIEIETRKEKLDENRY